MDITTNVVRQDLKVTKKAINTQKFGMVNIAANRIMSNLLVEDRKDLMIIGWMLKDLGGELNNIEGGEVESKLHSAIKSAKEHIGELESMLVTKRTRASDLWESYFDIEKKIRKDVLSDLEDDAYTEEHEFSTN